MDDNGVVDVKNVNWLFIVLCDFWEIQYKSKLVYVWYNDLKVYEGCFCVCFGKMKVLFGVLLMVNECGEIKYDVSLLFSDLGVNDLELGDIFRFVQGWDFWFKEEVKKCSKVCGCYQELFFWEICMLIFIII